MPIYQKSSGYLYYIRLRTEVGILYKLGFTQCKSISRRFSDDNGEQDKDYHYIDKVYFFKYLKNAGEVESFIHMYQSEKKAFEFLLALNGKRRIDYLPFSGNGQTELYYRDILKLDKNYYLTQIVKGKLLLYQHIFKKELRLGVFLIFFSPLYLIKVVFDILELFDVTSRKYKSKSKLKFNRILKKLSDFGIQPK